MKILIIGAGMCGLTAGRLLHEAGLDVTLLDKGRGVGGRMATRRIEDAVFDHGAQFLTARSDWFSQVVKQWQNDGVVAPWFIGSESGSHQRYRGAPSMNAITKHLANGLDVRTSCTVTAVRRDGAQWDVQLESGDDLACDACLITAPIPQALNLVSEADIESEVITNLRRIVYDPCFAVMCTLSGPSGLPPDGPFRPIGSRSIELISDNLDKGISAVPCITIHSRSDFARQHLEQPEHALEILCEEARHILGSEVVSAVIHRWRYAQPTSTCEAPFSLLSQKPPLVIAGDAFGGPRIEGAALSGHAAAAHIMTL